MSDRATPAPRLHVSRETKAINLNLPPADIAGACQAAGIHLDDAVLTKLNRYDALLLKWHKAINLVGPTTLEDRAQRHFLDSIQLLRHLPTADARLVDIGSGAGFPGLVLAMLGVREVHLVESDIRKSTFLREVSRETSTPVHINDRRVESTEIEAADILTARALAPLVDLLGYMYRLNIPTGVFLKGAQAEAEIAKAEKKWVFTAEKFASLTDAEAVILRITGLKPKTRT